MLYSIRALIFLRALKKIHECCSFFMCSATIFPKTLFPGDDEQAQTHMDQLDPAHMPCISQMNKVILRKV